MTFAIDLANSCRLIKVETRRKYHSFCFSSKIV